MLFLEYINQSNKNSELLRTKGLKLFADAYDQLLSQAQVGYCCSIRAVITLIRAVEREFHSSKTALEQGTTHKDFVELDLHYKSRPCLGY